MNPTLQTKFNIEGNCLQACVATIFGLKIGDVPEFDPDDCEWQYEFAEWLKGSLGKFLMSVELSDDSHVKLMNGSHCVTSINSDNPKVDRHAVITKGNRIVFDPMIGVVDKPINFEENPIFYIIGDIIK